MGEEGEQEEGQVGPAEARGGAAGKGAEAGGGGGAAGRGRGRGGGGASGYSWAQSESWTGPDRGVLESAPVPSDLRIR